MRLFPRSRAGLFAASLLPLLAACGAGSEDPATAVTPEPITPPPTDVVGKQCIDANTVMEQRLALLGPAETAAVIVSFEGRGPLAAPQLKLLEGLGLGGVFMQKLPIAGLIATKAQIQALQKLPGVRSVRFNDQLSYDDDVARRLSSVEQAQASPDLRNAAGEPITGKGVTILVNDSGVDGLHPDLAFGTKVIENVQGHTNLQGLLDLGLVDRKMFPFTPTEGVPNTDLGGSHGTHVAGIAAGDGTASDGKFAGAAKGASLIGYGSGAVLLVLDTIGGFDYAMQTLDEHPEYNLRIVTNSFGNTGDVDTCFDPEDPTNIATKALADRGVLVVFSAGNSGSGHGTITGNFKKAPWVLTAGNGEKTGLLAPSSSRGRLSGGVYEVEVDGEKMIVEDRPTVVTPGTDIISARAIAADPFAPLDTEADIAAGDIPPEQIPYYTHKTGTSMAAPHLAGLTALLLEANPALTWREIKPIFKASATNMPGYAAWETGAGFANVEAALAMALNLRKDYGAANKLLRGAFASTGYAGSKSETYSLIFEPTGALSTVQEFEVGADTALVVAKYSMPDAPVCTCAVLLIDPAGNRYGSGIALPVLGANVAATAPGMAGTWTVQMRGIGSVSGVALDPTGMSNGVAPPATAEVKVEQFLAGAPVGVDDVVGHPLEQQVLFAVSRRLVDGAGAKFEPDAPLTRGLLAEYLMQWGLRQTRAIAGTAKFADAADNALLSLASEAVTRKGQLLMDLGLESAPLMLLDGASFNAGAVASREQVAYALVQATGHEAAAKAIDPAAALSVTDADGNTVPVMDAGEIDPALRGHLAVALQLGILDAEIREVAGAKQAYLRPKAGLSRAEYAAFAARTYASVPFPS